MTANAVTPLKATEAAMWRLVQRYTGKVGYRRPVKAEGLTADPPVIDCSGWAALLLTEGMVAANAAAGRTIFEASYVAALHAWSDRIISEIESRTGVILSGPEISAASLPRCATIGLKMGEPEWAANHPRLRGITHFAQIVRHPKDDVPFVSEAIGMEPDGIRLTALADWLASWCPQIEAGEVWAVDAFRHLMSTDGPEAQNCCDQHDLTLHRNHR